MLTPGGQSLASSCVQTPDRNSSSVQRDESSQVDLADGPPGSSRSVREVECGELAEEK